MTFLRNEQEETAESKTQWRIGEYTRLSKEDGDKPQSDSIQNQHRIIENHIAHMEKQGESIASVTVYSDDGYAGGSFQRPAFQQLKQDIEAGKLNCVIFKDLSRLGRNYPEVGKLMEEYFPQKGIRVISVLNSLDSLNSPETYCSAIVSFSNIVNDDYIRQLSIKIKSTLRMKRNAGEFLGNYAPYGYLKDPNDRHHLLIDDETAGIVRMIFNWYADGAAASGIVKRLNAMHIDPPSVHKMRTGCKGFSSHSSGGQKSGIWAQTTVNTMLRDEVYIGNLVQGKCRSESYRTKRMVTTAPEQWTVIEGTHEAIISDEQFTIVHERLARHTRGAPEKGVTYLLSGMVLCGGCGRRMTRCISNGHARYRCPTRTYAPDRCQISSVKETKLEQIALQAVQRPLLELHGAKSIIDAARKRFGGKSEENEYLLAVNRAIHEKKRLEEAQFRLFDSLQKGLIDEEDFSLLREKYKDEAAKQTAYVAQLEKSLSDLKKARKEDDEFVEYFEANCNIPFLDRTVVTQMIDHMEVNAPDDIAVYMKISPMHKKICQMASQLAEEQEENQQGVC